MPSPSGSNRVTGGRSPPRSRSATGARSPSRWIPRQEARPELAGRLDLATWVSAVEAGLIPAARSRSWLSVYRWACWRCWSAPCFRSRFSSAPHPAAVVVGKRRAACKSKVPGEADPDLPTGRCQVPAWPEGPAILAGINWVETAFGTNLGVSSAEAEGWMQFLPSSWEAFGVDGNGNGKKDPYNPWDAIFAAARLLRYSGAPGNWHDAIYSYNHAEWYVKDVLADAEKWAGESARSRNRRGLRSGSAERTCRAHDRRGRPPQRHAPGNDIRLGRLAWPLADAAKRPVRLQLGGQPSAPGRRVPQPYDGHRFAFHLGQAGTGPLGDDPRQALRTRSPHLSSSSCRGSHLRTNAIGARQVSSPDTARDGSAKRSSPPPISPVRVRHPPGL